MNYSKFFELASKYPLDPLNKLVYRFLYANIVDLTISPGSKLSISNVSNNLNVSRTTVKEAFNMLQSVGLATVQSGHGLYVKDLDIYELQEVRTSREALEVKAVWLLTERATAEDINQLESINRSFEQAVLANDFKTAQPINKQFHKTILELCANKFLLQMYAVIECHIDRYFVYAPVDNSIIKKTDIYSHFAVKQHDSVINGIKTCIPDIAAAAMQNHINSAQAHIMPNLF
jgi:DNA-binding GntR family transcriptional regulator